MTEMRRKIVVCRLIDHAMRCNVDYRIRSGIASHCSRESREEETRVRFSNINPAHVPSAAPPRPARDSSKIRSKKNIF